MQLQESKWAAAAWRDSDESQKEERDGRWSGGRISKRQMSRIYQQAGIM